MAEDVQLTLELDSELRQAFLAEAPGETEGARILRDFIRNFVMERRAGREHDAWFRAEVEQGLREADDPAVERILHEQVMAEMKARLEQRLASAAKRAS